MMGHINNLVVEMVRDALGDDAVADLFAKAELESRIYQPEVVYPESEFQALFRGAQSVFGVGSDDAEEAFAAYFMKRSPEMFPAIFEQAGSARGLIERIPTIHRNFPASASQDAYRDKVAIIESTPERIVLEYDSPNQLCNTLRRVARICLDYFGEEGAVHETCCKKEGAEHCRVVIEFHGQKAGV
ncbi:MAG: heme NO-binding domain-containing protein [bacterium]|nr:heme NO-binding domain-containing protein [bacterium]